MKKFFAILLVLVMLIGVFTGCGGKKQPSDLSQENSLSEDKDKETDEKDGGKGTDSEKLPLVNTDSLVPVVNEPVTLNLAITVGTAGDDPNDMPWFKWMTEETGINWEFTIIEAETWGEKKPIMLATDDLPEIFFGQGFSNSEIMKFGYAGSFIPLNDYIDKYGDQIKDKVDMVDGAKAGIVCPDGNIYSLPQLTLAYPYSGFRPWINQEWLTNLGLDNPTTIDEFYDVLTAFKNDDPNDNGKADEIPWSGSWNDAQQRSIPLTGFGFITFGDKNNNIALTRDGKAVFMPLHENYKLYIEFMRKCYLEGLIDQDIFSQDETQFLAKAETDVIGVAQYPAPFLMVSDYENWTSMYPLVQNTGDKPVCAIESKYNNGKFVVTKACENPDVAVRFANLFYTPWYSASIMYGPLDENGVVKSSYYPENYSNISVDGEDSIVIDNPSWSSDEMTLWDYYCLHGPVNSNFNFALDDSYALSNIFPWDPLKNANPQEAAWRYPHYDNIVPHTSTAYPNVFFSEDDLEKIEEIRTPLEDLVEQWEAKFITGAESLDNYDAFITAIKDAGAEEYQKIHVDAYEVYLSNVK